MSDVPADPPTGEPDPMLPPPPTGGPDSRAAGEPGVSSGGYCRHCGTPLAADAAFCSRCGQPTAAAPTQSGGLPPPPAAPGQGFAYAVPVRQKTNGLAVAALVLGIVWIYWLGSILALIFGYVAKNQIDKSNGTQGGRGMAIAGIVLGWVGVGTLLIVIVLLAIGNADVPST